MSTLTATTEVVQIGDKAFAYCRPWDGRPLTARGYLAFDTETEVLKDDLRIPRLALASACTGGESSCLIHPDQVGAFILAHPQARWSSRTSPSTSGWSTGTCGTRRGRMAPVLVGRLRPEPHVRHDAAGHAHRAGPVATPTPGPATWPSSASTTPGWRSARTTPTACATARSSAWTGRTSRRGSSPTPSRTRSSPSRLPQDGAGGPAAPGRPAGLPRPARGRRRAVRPALGDHPGQGGRNAGAGLPQRHAPGPGPVQATESDLRARRDAAVEALRGLCPDLFKTRKDKTTGQVVLRNTRGGAPSRSDKVLQAQSGPGRRRGPGGDRPGPLDPEDREGAEPVGEGLVRVQEVAPVPGGLDRLRGAVQALPVLRGPARTCGPSELSGPVPHRAGRAARTRISSRSPGTATSARRSSRRPATSCWPSTTRTSSCGPWQPSA